MSDPKGFLKADRETPRYRPVDERLKDWKEMARPLTDAGCATQASRCMDCGVPFCQGDSGCPVENRIPDFNDLVHRGKWQEAWKSVHSTNNFPELTGRLCPAPCETACVLGITDQPVAVRTLEWAIADRGFQEGWLTPVKAPLRSGKRVAIVGSGPAGLAAAQQLARLGHSVTVYEKADRVGGLLRYGIPDFKMEKGILERRLEQLRAEGVQFECGVDVGADSAALGALLSGSDAVGLAIGAEKPRELSLPGRLLKGVHLAMEYLEQANRAQAGMAPPPGGWISAQGKRILILGGGDTGSDCLGTAHRQGCLSATQVEIQPEPPKDRAATTPWPYWPLQLRTSHAHEEGGSRFWSVETLELLGDAQGRVKQIRARMGGAAGGERLLDAELVLIAAGFTGVRTGGLVERLGVKLDARGAIATDAQFKTSVPKVFAAGDARRGASLIVWAIAEGRRMAESIHRALSGGS